MVRTPSSATRRYRSPLRADQAEETRNRILAAATRLFVANGYTGTTVSAVAAEAGVVPETIYGKLGGKRGLLEGVIETTIIAYRGPLLEAGHEPSGRRAEIDRLATAEERLRAWCAFACAILAHTSPIHAVIRGAADGETFAVDLRERLLRERLGDVTESMRRYLTGSLRTGVSAEQAGERACALMSPELHHLVTVDLGWTVEEYREWLCRLLVTELLAP